MDDDGADSRGGDPQEGFDWRVERDDNDSGYDSRSGVDHADGDELLVWIDLVVVDAAEGCHPITTSVSGDRDGGWGPYISRL
jgi:hypothetical protein